ncbi:Hypothetical protein NTJ_04537 [Nesidiocoris tenuis]|uniref:HAUS augmin-like complex subunit 6 N-terminal domain-containing protein n=1 Tax=Nesidiocoris tenuis TaxID=355587 RepID=A0ABN7AK01_9HEMI|nr:Hypothetical protein NTJ_04537 [Nesidiocoris tenuis]
MDSFIAKLKDVLLHLRNKHPFPEDLDVLIEDFGQGIFNNRHRFSSINYLLSVIDKGRAVRLLNWPTSEDHYIDFARGVCTYILEFNRDRITPKIAPIGRAELLSPTSKEMGRFLMDLAAEALKCSMGEAALPLKENVPDPAVRLSILRQKCNAYRAYNAKLESVEATTPRFRKLEQLEKLREVDHRLQERMVQLLSSTPISATSTDDISALYEVVKGWVIKELSQDENNEFEEKLNILRNSTSALDELTALCRSLKTPCKLEKSKLTISSNAEIDAAENSKVSLSPVDRQRSLSVFYDASLRNIAGVTNTVVHSTHMGSIRSLEDAKKTLVDLDGRFSSIELKAADVLKRAQDYLAELTAISETVPEIPLVYTYERRPGPAFKFEEIKKQENLDTSAGDDWEAELEEELRTGMTSCSKSEPRNVEPTPLNRSSSWSTISSRRDTPAQMNSILQPPLSSSSPIHGIGSTPPATSRRTSIDDLVSRYKDLKSKINMERLC